VSSRKVIVVGGGAAGFFAAITAAQANRELKVTLLEKGPRFLSKVRISGGGRCNVTHANFDPRALAERYPRGAKELIGPLHRFDATETVEWFEKRGVKLKAESDGRMFPVTDSSETVIACLMKEATSSGIDLRCNTGVERASRNSSGGFDVVTSGGEHLTCDMLLLAMGGCRVPAACELATALGHSLVAPVPSLFTFHIESNFLGELAGISVAQVEASVPKTSLRERGALLVTHWGLSGPAILRLSAWGARILHELKYSFALHVNWLPDVQKEGLAAEFQKRRRTQAARLVVNLPLAPLPARLWEQLVLAAGIDRGTRWSALSRSAEHKLIETLQRTEFKVTGKSLNKDEFVTCGGVPLNEVNLKTMESRICPALYFAGEILDIDGITGGFNFQAAWTSGWIAGNAIAAVKIQVDQSRQQPG